MVQNDGVLPQRAERVRNTARAAVVAAAALAALAPVPPALVERVYSRGLYPAWQQVATPLGNRVPFALFDVLIVVAAGFWLARTVVDVARARRAGWAQTIGRIAMRTIVGAAALYVLFLLAWGLNYRRVPLTEKLRFDAGRVTPDAARDLAFEAVAQLNALHGRAHAQGWPSGDSIDAALAAAFDRTGRDLGARLTTVPGRPKSTALDVYFRRAAVEGMTDPYLLETLVASDLLAFERPFIVAHEWSHLAGYANEADASFVGWLTCLRAGDQGRYSGWLFLYGELSRAVRTQDYAPLVSRLDEGPRADLRAIAERMRRNVSPRLSVVGWQVYDRFLKANRVESGAASYAEVLRLALGVEFGPDWTPIMIGREPRG